MGRLSLFEWMNTGRGTAGGAISHAACQHAAGGNPIAKRGTKTRKAWSASFIKFIDRYSPSMERDCRDPIKLSISPGHVQIFGHRSATMLQNSGHIAPAGGRAATQAAQRYGGAGAGVKPGARDAEAARGKPPVAVAGLQRGEDGLAARPARGTVGEREPARSGIFMPSAEGCAGSVCTRLDKRRAAEQLAKDRGVRGLFVGAELGTSSRLRSWRTLPARAAPSNGCRRVPRSAPAAAGRKAGGDVVEQALDQGGMSSPRSPQTRHPQHQLTLRAIVEVVTKAPAATAVLQIDMGRGNHAQYRAAST